MSNQSPPPHVLQAAIAHWQATGAVEWMPMVGLSMWPLLRAGDLIQVAFGETALHKNDLCVFQQNGQIIAHRVMGLGENDTLLTRGDHVTQFDEVVRSAEIYGLIRARKRNKHILRFDTRFGRFYAHICHLIAQTHIRAITFLHKLGLRRPQFFRKT